MSPRRRSINIIFSFEFMRWRALTLYSTDFYLKICGGISFLFHRYDMLIWYFWRKAIEFIYDIFFWYKWNEMFLERQTFSWFNQVIECMIFNSFIVSQMTFLKYVNNTMFTKWSKVFKSYFNLAGSICHIYPYHYHSLS